MCLSLNEFPFFNNYLVFLSIIFSISSSNFEILFFCSSFVFNNFWIKSSFDNCATVISNFKCFSFLRTLKEKSNSNLSEFVTILILSFVMSSNAENISSIVYSSNAGICSYISFKVNFPLNLGVSFSEIVIFIVSLFSLFNEHT